MFDYTLSSASPISVDKVSFECLHFRCPPSAATSSVRRRPRLDGLYWPAQKRKEWCCYCHLTKQRHARIAANIAKLPGAMFNGLSAAALLFRTIGLFVHHPQTNPLINNHRLNPVSQHPCRLSWIRGQIGKVRVVHRRM